MTVESAASQPSIEQIIATELSVTRDQIWSAIKLLDSGSTVPFIARYRKEATGGLSDTHLRMLSERLDYLRELESRRSEILQSIKEQGKLTETLKNGIEQAATKSQLEDLYLPFRPRKRTKAQTARESGLEALAQLLLSDPTQNPEEAAKAFVNPDKNVFDLPTALNGAREILMENFAEAPALIGALRQKFWETGWVISRVIKDKEDPESKFTDYFNFREPIREIPSHRLLALLRGRQENILRVSLETEGYSDYGDARDDGMEYIQAVCAHFGVQPRRRAADAWLLDTAKQAWKYKIRIHLELDILAELRKKSEEEAIHVFAENVKSLLLAAPAGARPTVGLDPGFRTGVKVAAIDKTGKVVQTGVIYPHAPQNDWERSVKIMAALIKKYDIELIAIGNGTASRETDKLVTETLKLYPELKAQKVVVSEAGASVYSASELASAELPELDVSIRGAVSIARRLQDPLAELVKIDPKAIGVGQYQHDVNQRRLEQMLHNVVEDCVNAVGVEVNTASPSLLSYVSGLTRKTASGIVAHRDTHGPFKNRQQLLGVPDLGPKAFEQAAGFLRIRNGDNALDFSGVHPESYPVVERLLAKNQKILEGVLGNAGFLRALRAEDYVDAIFGLPTVKDILAELEKPGRDPRPEFRTATFKEGVHAIDDLKIGMILEGTVTNVANFGAFVDIGVHQDGLIHISQLSNQFVKDPRSIVKTGQVVKVKVLEIDKPRKRISLSMNTSATAVSRPPVRR